MGDKWNAYEAVVSERKAYERKYYEDNKERISAKNKQYRIENKNIISEQKRLHKESLKENSKEKIKIRYRIKSRDDIKNLSDRYIKGRIHKSSGISESIIPPELIEIKRTILKTKRLCKTLKNSEVN